MNDDSTPVDDKTLIDGHRVAAELLEDWRVLRGALHARFSTGDFSTGARLVSEIASAADAADHHPDVDLRYPHLDVRLTSHDVGGLTMRDVRMAREISALAAGSGASADPDAVQLVEVALDCADAAAIRPFWAAVLALPADGDDDADLVDPDGRVPSLWFQRSDAHDEPRQRFHLDVHVPDDVAERRVRAALQAGGVLVEEGRAPSYWVLADAEGNNACVCTWLEGGQEPDND